MSEFFCVAFTRFWFIATSVPSVSSSHNAQNKKMLVKRRGVFAVQKTKMNFDQILSVDKLVKFIYSEKAPNFCEISTVDLSYVVPVKSTVEVSQNFVAFSEYMNFISLEKPNLILHHISWCISSRVDPDFSHWSREDKKLKKKANAVYGTSQEIGRTNLCAVHSQARLGNFFMHFLLCIHLPSLQQDVPELNGVSRL